jgi:hypothetical protein
VIQGVLLAAHVVAGILFVGPVSVTTSLFPRFVPAEPSHEPRNRDVATLLHRITRTYAVGAVAVPVIGLALAAAQGRLTEVWILLAMVLTAVAGGLLALQIVPLQRDTLSRDASASDLRTLRSLTGVFNLLWVTVVVLMVLRPGAGA